jgi:hypothetical protein
VREIDLSTRNLVICGLVAAVLGGSVTYAVIRGSKSGQAGTTGATRTSDMSGMTSEPTSGSVSMAGMLAVGDVSGLNSSADGYTLELASKTLTVAKRTRFSFRVVHSDDRPVRAFQIDATKMMHLIIVRRDLTSYQHVHPSMAPDGTWSIAVAVGVPGNYRAFADFATGGKRHVLGVNLKAPGATTTTPLPPPRTTVRVDGYSVTFQTGMLMAGSEASLHFTVTRAGTPVTNLQHYLGNLGHLVIIRERTLQYLHVHPTSIGGGGPDIHFTGELAHAGRYRAFLQFQIKGRVHTAAFTLRAHAGG